MKLCDKKEMMAKKMKSKKGKGSLNPVQKSKDNMVMEGKDEQENN